MNDYFQTLILDATRAKSLHETEMIQSLWSGYGKIVRYGLDGTDRQSVVVKHVQLNKQNLHPRGWDTDLSHQRKLKSYQVEVNWYKNWSRHCDFNCRVPECLAVESRDDEVLMVFEDLDASGFSLRKTSVSEAEMQSCLAWLANFHATFIERKPEGLWEVGTYWHLDTRPDEWQALKDAALKNAAGLIDKKLRNSQFQTFVHGDAKLANFCFPEQGNQVAAVDFQYVGGGCGMKDVAYFIGSCLYEEDCQHMETALLDFYFQALREALTSKQKKVDADVLEAEWRNLYPVAWTDFHRFVKGWSPGHWKIHGYSERLAREVVLQLEEA